MISHLSECIEKGLMVGYGGLLTCVFKKFGVPLDGLEFPMSANNKISERCLTNLHLQLNEKGILEHAIEEVEVSSDDDKEEEKTEKEEYEGEKKEEEKEEQDTVPSATLNEAEVNKEEEQVSFKGEADSKGEQVKDKENVALEDEQSSLGDEDLHVPLKKIKKSSVLIPRKSKRLTSKSSSCLHADITSQTPPSPKPGSPIPFHIPSSPPSPIPTTPTPTGFDDNTTIPPPPPTLAHVLTKVLDLQSQLCAFQSEVRVSLTSLADQLTLMETRLGAKLDTVEVQTEYIDEETAA